MIHFLAGLPRSGSTLLGALLSQRLDLQVSATSGLIDVMGAVATTWENLPQSRSGDMALDNLYPVLRGMITAYYPGPRIAIDKSRGWPDPNIMSTMGKVLGHPPRIIATVRPIAECLASCMKIAKWDRPPKEFLKVSPLAHHLFHSYATLKAGWEAHPENFYFVQYDDLVNDPQLVCEGISAFLDLPPFAHTLHSLSNPVPENDEKTWGLPGLHHVKATIERSSWRAEDVLGEKLFSHYQGGEFWTGKPDPEHEPNILDFTVEAGLHGDFDKAWDLAQKAAENKNDLRAQFNKGWYLLRRGDLHDGLMLIDRGREENLIGHEPRSAMPMWDGRRLRGETVVLQGENGHGDQIIHARFAKDIAARGARVVIACQPGLAPILSTIDGVSAVVQGNVTGGVYHHYHVPMMSACRILGYEYRDLDGSPYIKWPGSGSGKVGICWRGDPRMTHDEYRQFDPKPLFDLPANLVSLQKEWDGEIPPHIKRPTLDTWEQTATVIAGLDLVISSCTGVAHLAAAMGKPTWILVPLLPYYLWALPGKSSPWYDGVRLFRQIAYKDWAAAFEELYSAFNEWRVYGWPVAHYSQVRPT